MMSRLHAADLAWADQEAAKSVRLAIPNVRQPARWVEPGQIGWCWTLGFVIACEIGFIASVLVR